jgi:hypothetical protein
MRHDVQSAVAVRGEDKARLNILGGEVGKIVQRILPILSILSTN